MLRLLITHTDHLFASMVDTRQSLRRLTSLIGRKWAEARSTEQTQSLSNRLLDVFLRTWDLGFTAFGGPPVHFQIIYARFVDGKGGGRWIDEQTVNVSSISILSETDCYRQYQELFAICQALPGPGSTKMLFCVTLLHAGFLPAIFVFILWRYGGLPRLLNS